MGESMKKFKVRLLVPYIGLMENIISISADYPTLDLQVSVATLDTAVRLAIDAEQNNFDMIVSRGDTMSMIRNTVSIPVFNIDITGDDLLRVISLTETYSGKWTFLGFPLIMEQAASLCSTLRNNASVHIIHSYSECETKIQALREEGYSLIVGDAVTVTLAAKHGMNNILISSSEDSVRKTLDNISFFCQYMEKYDHTIRLYQQVMSKSPRHTLVFDKKKNLVLYSGLHAIELCAPLLPYIERAFAEPSLQTILMQNEELWKIESRQLDGPDIESQSYVAFFCNQLNHTKVLQDFSKKESIRFFDPVHEQKVNFDSFVQNSSKMESAVLIAQKYCTTEASLLFLGEEGVETDSLIHAVYQSSSHSDNSMIQIECSSLSSEQWEELLSNGEKSLYHLLKNTNYTLYLKDVEQIPQDAQLLLYKIVSQATEFGSLRLLLSASPKLRTCLENGKFSQKLYYAVSPLEIEIPPLRERKEDFSDLCSLAIGEYNIRYGKSISGIENSAMECLKNYGWPGNLPQFNNALSFLIQNAQSGYITLQDVESVIALYPGHSDTYSDFPLDLNGTLEDIEKSIIKYIFESEGRNTSKAATRLGIGRSTLWRKLKEGTVAKVDE